MKLTLKRSELVNLNGVLNDIVNSKNEVFDKRFIFSCYRNIEYLKPEIESIKSSQQEPQRYQEFQDKIVSIGKECADKNELGQPKTEIKNGQEMFVISEKQQTANKLITELQSQYSDVIEAQKKNLEVFNQLMEENVEIEICQVSFNYLPDKYDITQFKVLKYIIKESDSEIEAML